MQNHWPTVVAVFGASFSVLAFGAEDAQVRKLDPQKAAKVPVVLRVKLVKPADAVEKYGWDQVEVLEVYKNEPKAEHPRQMAIAFRNTDPGVPKGESTVYLVAYRTPPDGLWRLVATSHVEKPKDAERREAADSRPTRD